MTFLHVSKALVNFSSLGVSFSSLDVCVTQIPCIYSVNHGNTTPTISEEDGVFDLRPP